MHEWRKPEAELDEKVQRGATDEYEIVLAGGHRECCGRSKAEQFKRLDPS